MRNRAKCKLCEEVIESLHPNDLIQCTCGEIAIEGGEETYRAMAKDWSNFLRIDDEDNEIEVTITEGTNQQQIEKTSPINEEMAPPTKKEIYQALVDLKKSYEQLPEQAMSLPISHYDMLCLLMVLTELLKDE